jgi:hypothetical protein
MAKYKAEVDIDQERAIAVLDELATDGSPLREALEESKGSAQRALKEIGISVPQSSLPDEIKLPPPEQVAALRDLARGMVERGWWPFGWFVLATVFSAMPVVDAPERDGPG